MDKSLNALPSIDARLNSLRRILPTALIHDCEGFSNQNVLQAPPRPKLQNPQDHTLVSSVCPLDGVNGLADCMINFGEDTFVNPVDMKISCYFPEEVSYKIQR